MRRPTALALGSGLGLVLACVGCSEPGTDGPDTPVEAEVRLEPSCPEAGPPHEDLDVDFLNQLMAEMDLPAWQAADIGASTRLGDGRIVWVFGDTMRTAAFEPRIVSNSMLLTSAACTAQLRTANDGPVIPDESADVVSWPMSVVALPPIEAYVDPGVDEQLVVIVARTRRGDANAMDFTYLGSSAAIFSLEWGGVPELENVVELTPDDPSLDQVNWGAAASVSGRWIQVYGTRLTGHAFGRELYAARTPVDDPGDRERWEFWDGDRWQSEIAASVAVIPAEGGVSQTLSVHRVGRQWVAVSKCDGDLGDFVCTWKSSTPRGPWTRSQEYAAPSDLAEDELRYAPLGHPEIDLSGGDLLVSVSRNTTDLARLAAEPEIGRPEFGEVALP